MSKVIPVPESLGLGITAAAIAASVAIEEPLESQIEKELNLTPQEESISPPIATVDEDPGPSEREIAMSKIIMNINEYVTDTHRLVEGIEIPAPISCPEVKPVVCPTPKPAECPVVSPIFDFESEVTELTPAQRLRVKADDLKGDF